MSQSNSTKTLGVFLFGTVIGATIALLFAPTSGEELREDLKKRGDDLLDRAEDFTRDAKKSAKNFASSVADSDILNEGKMRAEAVVSDVRSQAKNILSDAERIIKDAKGKAADRF